MQVAGFGRFEDARRRLALADFYPRDASRVAEYERRKRLFFGRHVEVFSSRLTERLAASELGYASYIVVNFARVAALVSADLLFGEPPDVEAGASSEFVARVSEASGLPRVLFEAAVTASICGDVYLKVYAQDGEVFVEAVPPERVFPVFDGSSPRPVAYEVAWLDDDGATMRYERHEPGRISYGARRLDGRGLAVEVAEPTVVATGASSPLVFHVPNYRVAGEFFGVSDFVDIEPLVDELNNRFSQVADILDRHADPKLALPETLYASLVEADGTVRKENLAVVAVPDDAAVRPEYITWDAQLDSCFREIDYLLKALMMVTETSPDAFGLSERGAAESGRALKFRMLRTLAKVQRKRAYFDASIKHALRAAQEVGLALGLVESVEPVSITWHDGLPVDAVEQAQVEQIRTGGRATSSVESAIVRLDDVSREAAAEEVARIRAEIGADLGVGPDEPVD